MRRKCCKYLSPSSTLTYLQSRTLKIPTLTSSTLTPPLPPFSSHIPTFISPTNELATAPEQHPGTGSSSQNHPSPPPTNLTFPSRSTIVKTPPHPFSTTLHVTLITSSSPSFKTLPPSHSTPNRNTPATSLRSLSPALTPEATTPWLVETETAKTRSSSERLGFGGLCLRRAAAAWPIAKRRR